MIRFVLLLIIAAVWIQTSHAADALPIQAGTSVYVNHLLTDDNGNMYMCGNIRGRVWIGGKLTDEYSDKSYPVLVKLNKDLTFEWLVKLEAMPREAKIIDNKIYLLHNRDFLQDEFKTKFLVLSSWDLKGNLIMKRDFLKIAGITNLHTGIRLFNDGVFTWTTWKGEDNTLEFDNRTMTKKRYSQCRFAYIDFNGKELWEYTIEGGIGGFTDLRIQKVTRDNEGNTYVVSYFSHSADLGIANFTTKEMYPEVRSQPLHYNALFIMKFDPFGKPLKAELLAENDMTIEDMQVDSEGNVLLAGYHRGNDTFAKMQEDGRPYIGAKLKGEAFHYTREMSMEGPTDDAFIAMLDKDWKVKWKHNFFGDGYNRCLDIITTVNGFAVTGMFAKTIQIGDNQYTEHPDNQGYADGFYFEINTEGKISNVQLFTGVESNVPQLWQSPSGKGIVTVSTKSEIVINGKTHKGFGHWGGTFVYVP